MARWFNYPDDGSAHANIIRSSTSSLVFCKFPLDRKPCTKNWRTRFRLLILSHVHCFIGHAIVLGRMDRCSVSFVSSKLSHS